MDLLPVFIPVRQRTCLVVGGGEVALRKITLLIRAGAVVRVVSPTLCSALEAFSREEKIQWQPKPFSPEDLTGVALAIAATNDEVVNRAVSETAQARHIPVNVVDQPALCTFIFPSIIDRSPIVIAVSSGGRAPVLSRLLRARLETLIPSGYGRLAELAGKFRDQVKQRISEPRQRRIFWENIFEGPVAEQMLAGHEKAAHQALQKTLDGVADSGHHGEVYLVGGGPGDPDLLTFRALRLMQKADIVVYDALVSPAVLDLVRRDAERIYVGKRNQHHTLPQEEINEMLVRLAREGKRVLRLKGGDPFIFGRGGEEIETLTAHQIPFQIVPGISAANGVSTYTGIPLTHRDYAQSVIFTTGHLRHGTVDLDWASLCRPHQTVVIYMGLGGLADICSKLIQHGLPEDMPAAVIQQGTTANQRVVAGTLATLPALVDAAHLEPPCLTIVGEVVRLREKLAWFEPNAQQPTP
jgi:uroporphyrin-III C-methyltransferase/precorrin-2 dehydrogenase/sirohydrochlorin ferrochelatase